MKKILFTAMMFVFSFQTIAYCQAGNDATASQVSRLKTLLTNHEIEKAYLHFDRPYAYYVGGEVVYFKAYVTMGERHEPSTISSVLHVDLIDKNDVLMQSIALQLTDGTGWGDFALPEKLQKGSYRIRAYTEWMRNDKSPYFFDQYISVSSQNGADRVKEAANKSALPGLQLFPEGGNMVADVHSKVAFKAVGADGLGINVTGVVVDNENKEVAKIASAHLGMGTFDFVPEEGKAYQAKVTFANGTQSSVELPVEPKGITLSVNTDDPSKISVEIKANEAYYKENLNKELNLMVYSAGSVRKIQTKLASEVLRVDVPAKTFHTGVLQVTLLSGTGEPLNERLSFIQNPDLLNLSIAANKQVYSKRENVQLSLNAKNNDGNAVNGSFSVSVVDESKIVVDENTENTILSYLLLSSDVKGYVEKPNYYFANVTKETRAELDALMLTQGYRRFVWKELMDDNSAAAANAYSPEKEIDISGVLKTRGGEPIADCQITMVAKAGGMVLAQATDAQGRFRFQNVQFETGTQFILRTQSPAGKKGVLTLDNPAQAPGVSPGNAIEAKYNANADILASFQTNQRQGVITASTEPGSILLKNDKVTGSKSTDNYRSSNLSGAGHADQVINGDDIKNAPSLSIGLSGRADGVQFFDGVPALGTAVTFARGGQRVVPMLVYVDGAEIGQGVNIDLYSPTTVETVEILKYASTSIYGMQGGNGVMVITTRRGAAKEGVIGKEMSPGIFSIEPKGFYKAREFYAPRYDAGQPANNLPDQRSTIFWKPDVTTDADGNASFNFFNADGVGTYRVEVQGIDSKGNLGMQVFRYKVQ